MARVVLVHWNAEEAEERAARLRALGHRVTVYGESGGAGLRRFRAEPPAAFVVDLSRLPSHGRAVGAFLRQSPGTRSVPLVFVAGLPEKVAKVRTVLPDAVYSSWRGIAGALRRSLARPPANPVRPGTMAGYSGTPLPRKLGIRHGDRVALAGAPPGFPRTLGRLPDGTVLVRGLRGRPDVILLFVRSRADLGRRWPSAAARLADRGRLWIVWPKKSSALAGDLGEADVRAHGLGRAFVDYKICAVDGTWSGLCFARRRAERPAQTP